MARIAVVVAVVVVCAFGSASASAATYYVASGGSDGNPCSQASPCATIGQALIVHRVRPTPSDVISTGAGRYVQSASATDPNDDGLTIVGTQGAAGSRDTT